LLTSRAVPGDLRDDGPLLVAAFGRLGIDAELVPWGGDCSAYDGAIVRGTWDYIEARDEFVAWAATVPRLANSADVLRWNTDKRYLRELEAAGIPVVPTVWSDAGAVSFPEGEFVVKPAVSAGGRNSARHTDAVSGAAHVRAIRDAGGVAMIQPFLPSVDTVGETGTYVFGGEVSHAIRKGGVLAPGVSPSDDLNLGSIDAVTAQPVDPVLADFASRVLAASPGPVLYARVDTVVGPEGQPLLIELEATEPYLFLSLDPAGANRFARAAAAWLHER
jgi:glutathione synthase/RimK-type ligase-like ATP-grasp enzyme